MSKEGLEMLRNEIGLFSYVHKYCRRLIGAVVPEVYAVCRSAETKEIALVLKHVGQSLERGEHGTRWSVDGTALTEEDCAKISLSAKKGIEELQRNGTRHNDTSPRNLRVQRDKSCTGWRTWWIGFGAAIAAKPE